MVDTVKPFMNFLLVKLGVDSTSGTIGCVRLMPQVEALS